jgi:hypothetical protein
VRSPTPLSVANSDASSNITLCSTFLVHALLQTKCLLSTNSNAQSRHSASCIFTFMCSVDAHFRVQKSTRHRVLQCVVKRVELVLSVKVPHCSISLCSTHLQALFSPDIRLHSSQRAEGRWRVSTGRRFQCATATTRKASSRLIITSGWSRDGAHQFEIGGARITQTRCTLRE